MAKILSSKQINKTCYIFVPACSFRYLVNYFDIMPKTRRESSSSSSDTSVHDSPPPAKKTKSNEGSGGSSGVRAKNGEVTWNISNNKMVKIRSFKGKTYIDIREYYDKNGELLPTKKGISLTPELYQKLKSLTKEIDEELNKC